MSDANKYINTYVDHAVGTIHEQVITILQLKTQLKIAKDVLTEREEQVSSLQQQLQECKETSAGLTKSVAEASDVKASYEAIKNKVSHMDALTGQLNEVKQALLAKNNELENLKKELDEKNILLSEKEIEIVNLTKQVPPPKKVINRKKVEEAESVPVVVPVVDIQSEDKNDDF